MLRRQSLAGVAVVLTTLAAGACSDDPDAGPGAATTEAVVSSTNTPDDSPPASSAPNSSPPADVVTPDGFERVGATVTAPDGTVCELCLWLADTGDRRRRGLMFVTDLGAADGMAFAYPTLHSGTFWMKNTVLPLSIAFFGAEGTYLSAFDMEPCTEDPCELYRTPADFSVAIETPRGGLAELGIGPGSVLDLTDLPCGDGA